MPIVLSVLSESHMIWTVAGVMLLPTVNQIISLGPGIRCPVSMNPPTTNPADSPAFHLTMTQTGKPIMETNEPTQDPTAEADHKDVKKP